MAPGTSRIAALACVLTLGCVPHPRPRTPAEKLELSCADSAGSPHLVGGPGPVRLVDVWATWCAPCLLAAPRVRQVLQRHPRVAGISLSVDQDPAQLWSWMARHPEHPVPGLPLHLDGGFSAATRIGIDRIPFAFALDARGRVAGVVVGYSSNYEVLLERMVSKAEGEIREPR